MTMINSGLKGLSQLEPVPDIFGIWDWLHEITMTLSINLVSARVQQQFIAVVNGLHGDGEVLKGNGDVFRAKKGRQRATKRTLIAMKRC